MKRGIPAVLFPARILRVGWILWGLPVAAIGQQLTIQPAAQPGQFQLDFFADLLRPYQLEGTEDFGAWKDCGPVIVGKNQSESSLIFKSSDQYFYRYRKGAVRPGFHGNTLAANDDDSTGEVALGFPIRIFQSAGAPGPWNVCFVNNNGNVTIGTPVPQFTPLPLQTSAHEIPGLVALFAPFWADVDTDLALEPGAEVKEVTYGTGMVNDRPAFAANWIDVGYYVNQVEKLNSFQIVLISRPDTGLEGNFDIEFNYNRIIWETGSHFSSGGVNGYGGSPARCGITNGVDRTVELTYSGQTLAQLDANPNTGLKQYSTGLIYRSRNTTVPGRFIFQIRDGAVLGALEVNAGPDVLLAAGVTEVTLSGRALDPSEGAVGVRWSVVGDSSGVRFSDASVLNPVVTLLGGATAVLQLTATSAIDPNISAADTMEIKR